MSDVPDAGSSEMCFMPGHQLKDKIITREITSRQLTKAVLGRIELLEPGLNAYVSFNREAALARADEIDRKISTGEPTGALAGLPVAVKDNLCTKGTATTCASRMLESFMPPYDATVVERLLAADAVIVGKTNMDEFAMGSSTENSAFGATHNPWDTDCIPGGSSGGSAAAVAAGEAISALGSDTGGSIRQPAAFCGVVGLKPTYGRVSRYGLVAYGSSLDQIGPITRDVRDCAMMMNVIAGHDPLDSTSYPKDIFADYTAELDAGVDGLNIGIPKEYFSEGLDPEIARAIDQATKLYERLGARLVDISLPHTQYAIAAYYIIATAEASSNLARYDGVHYGHRSDKGENIINLYSRSRSEGFGDEVKRRIVLGTFALSTGYYDAYYMKASKVRELLRRDFRAAWEQVDCIMSPAAPTAAFRIGEKTDPLQMYLSDIYTVSANLAGIPGITIPAGFTSRGLPIGLQVMAKPFDERRLLRIAYTFERETDHHLRRPEAK